MNRRLFTQSLLAAPLLNLHAAGGGLRIATFEVDVTPPLDSPLCHGNVTPARQSVTPLLARTIASAQAELREDPAAAARFLPGGDALLPGERLVQPELAATLERIATEGRDALMVWGHI